MNPVFAPWLLSAVLIGADDVVSNHHLPIPSRFLASFVAFGILGFLADTGLRPAAIATAWGLDVAIVMSLTSRKPGVLATVGGYVSQSAAPTPSGVVAAPK